MKTPVFLLLLLLVSCKYKKINVDINEFSELPPISYNDIIPYKSFECWELLYFSSSYDSVLYSSNNCNKKNIKYNFDMIGLGFDNGCHPTICLKYIASFNNDSCIYWSTPDDLRMFLGEIDNISEAQFLTKGFNYLPDTSSIYRITKNGYELIMYKLVRTGEPIQIDKFHLKVFSNGKIKILAREVFYRKYNARI